jgi:hypothetical protein
MKPSSGYVPGLSRSLWFQTSGEAVTQILSAIRSQDPVHLSMPAAVIATSR